MLGKNRIEPPRRAGLSVIGADVTVKGDIVTDGDLHLDGIVEGDIGCGTLIQGPSGRVIGTVRARDARIAGRIEGEVHVAALTIEKSARVTGDTSYETLTIETGAQVDGRMTPQGTAAAEPPLRLVDASDAPG